MKDKIVEQLKAKFDARSQVGIAKYGTTLDQNNEDNFLRHAQEEIMDLALYFEKILDTKTTVQDFIKKYPNDLELGSAIRDFFKK